MRRQTPWGGNGGRRGQAWGAVEEDRRERDRALGVDTDRESPHQRRAQRLREGTRTEMETSTVPGFKVVDRG